MEQYAEEFPPWQVAVGFPRSASGVLAPIASIVSSVSHNVDPSSVELFRGRMCRFIRIKYAANYENALPNAIGLSLKHDETTTRLCIGPNDMQSLSISVMCLTAYSEGGDDIESTPALSRLGRKTVLCILGGAKLGDLELGKKCAPNNGRLEFLRATSDSASSIILAIRYHTCAARILRKLLIIRCPCRSHIVSLGVARSLPNLDVSNLISMAHLIGRGKFSPIEARVTKLVSDAKIADTN